LKHRRTPVLGDESYGSQEWNKKLKRQGVCRPLLHAYETLFTNPFTGEELTIRAPLPQDIISILRNLPPIDRAFVSTQLSTINKDKELYQIVDDEGFLLVDTDVKKSIEERKVNNRGGFVPSDRLRIEEVGHYFIDRVII
jgi:hypothetical protein